MWSKETYWWHVYRLQRWNFDLPAGNFNFQLCRTQHQPHTTCFSSSLVLPRHSSLPSPLLAVSPCENLFLFVFVLTPERWRGGHEAESEVEEEEVTPWLLLCLHVCFGPPYSLHWWLLITSLKARVCVVKTLNIFKLLTVCALKNTLHPHYKSTSYLSKYYDDNGQYIWYFTWCSYHMTINYSSTSFIPYFIPYSLSSDYPNLFFTSVPLLVYDWRENQTCSLAS